MGRITISDLRRYVSELNDMYCKRTKNHLIINCAYGGYQVCLSGKTINKGLRTSRVNITYGFCSARETIDLLKRELPYLKGKIKFYEK